MVKKIFLVAVFVSAFLTFQRSWFVLISLSVALIFGYEQYLRAKMIEYRSSHMPGKIKTGLSLLPYSEEEFNNDLKGILPSAKDRYKVFSQRANLISHSISFNDGIRKTSFVPPNPTNKIYLFGGSTMLCMEVPDDYTIASQLQISINSGSTRPSKKYEVINCGVSGASLKANYEHFKQINILKGDICLFYFGVNEYDFSTADFEMRWPFSYKLFKQIEDLIKKLQLQSLARLFLKFKVFREDSFQLDKIVQADENLFNLINLRCESNEVKFWAFLQPHLFTKVPVTKIDKAHLRHYQNKADIQARHFLFTEFTNKFKEASFFRDARGVFNNIDLKLYVDWCHPNYLGNKIVADLFYSVIKLEIQ